MATEVEHIIDPDNGAGTDYTSASAWEAAQQRDLTSADEIAVGTGQCTGATEDTTVLSIAGWTTDATRYIKLWTDPSGGYRHSGKLSSGNVYRFNVTHLSNYQQVIDVNEDFVRLIGLQIHTQSSAILGNYGIRLNSTVADGAEIFVEQCVIKATLAGTSTGSYGLLTAWVGSGTRSLKMSNCVVYDVNRSTDAVYGIANDGGWVIYCYNVVVHNCYNGIYGGSGAMRAKNCIAQDCDGACYASTFHADSTNNCSDDGTQPGASGQNGEVVFLDEGNDDFHLDRSDTVALGNGTDLSGDADYPISVDIDNTTRTSWDIGADFFTMAAGTFYEMWELGQDDRTFYTEAGVDSAMSEASLGAEKIKVYATTLNTKEQIYSDT